MNILLILAISLSVSASVMLLLSRDLFRILVGIAVLGSAVNLIVFFSGHPFSLVPPIIAEGARALPDDAANPLPQALVLTAIVIGFALICYALVLGSRVSRDHGHTDVTKQQTSEGSYVRTKGDPLKPSVLEND